MDMDIVVLLEMVKYLNGQETINLCSTNKSINKICDKNSYKIWSMKLLLNYGINQNEIIGDPKSYYMGIEKNIGWYYSYDLDIRKYNRRHGDIENVKIQKHTREPINNENFFVPSINSLNNIKLIVGIIQLNDENVIRDAKSFVSKSLAVIKDQIMNVIYDDYQDSLNSLEIDSIYEVGLNEEINIKLDSNLNLIVRIFEVILL